MVTFSDSGNLHRRVSMRRFFQFTAAACLLFAAMPAHAQKGLKNGEWPTYGGDLGSTRYAPLDQINAENFNKLEVAWRFKTDSLGPRPEFKFEATPLMVHGVLYSTRRLAPRGGGAGCGDGRTSVDAQRERGSSRQLRATAAFRARLGVLDRRQGRANPLRDARLPADRAGRKDRHARCRLRQERRGRSEAG